MQDCASSAQFDSAPDHQETPKPPSGGFFIGGCNLRLVSTYLTSVVRAYSGLSI